MLGFNGLLPHEQLAEYERNRVRLSHEDRCVTVERSLTGVVLSFREDTQRDTIYAVAFALAALTDVAEDFDARRVAAVVDRAFDIRKALKDEGR